MNGISKLKLLAIVCLAAPACQSASAKPRASADLLRVGGRAITVSDAQARVDALSPEKRAVYKTPAQRADYLRSLLDHEVLAAEAEALGYANAPEVLAAAKHAMVVKLLKQRIGERPEPGAIDESAARAYYAAHPSEFGPPERAVVALIHVKDAALAHNVRAEAERAVEDAGKQGGATAQFSVFHGLVAKYTDEPGARDLTLALDRNLTAYPDAVIAAAAGMNEVGSVSAPISTDAGHFILQLKERLAASVLPFERVKEHAFRAASEELRDKKTAALARELASKHHAEIHEDRFASVKFEDSR